MIDVYTANTPNGIKVPIALEELGLPYRLVRIDLSANQQKQPEFLHINPNGRIPAIVDSDGPDGEPLNVFESGAILWYLGEKFHGLLPLDPRERVSAMEYCFFQVGGVGPMFGQAGWFMRQSSPIPLAVQRYQDESRRLTAVLEARLQVQPWLAGRSYSIADIMNYGWLRQLNYAGVDAANYPAVEDWLARISARPAVIRALAKLAN
ncbi:glutathione S-transferase family protein [Roseateles oligotrophus]|uniref:Glutathione binding-like protein n=1 Tax=Roseateles oligotrophus TaxID=1769250 RepID=A0ABT2YH19_9BURK|nr:glutathione binding-like protein [Roseateles oligotrophus]MCV2369356.1 glutathione binding-like protein [Roseateles oligotrophus]